MKSDGEGLGTTFFFELPLYERKGAIHGEADSDFINITDVEQGMSVMKLQHPLRQKERSFSISQVAPSQQDDDNSGSETRLGFPFPLLSSSFSAHLPIRKRFFWRSKSSYYDTTSEESGQVSASMGDEYIAGDEEVGFSLRGTDAAPSLASSVHETTDGLGALHLLGRSGLSHQGASSTVAGRRAFLLDQLQSPDSVVSWGHVDQSSQQRKFRVMVVDDTASTRKIVSKLLVGLGHKVEEASDGLQFLAKMGILQSDDYEEPSAAMMCGYDFILMDDNMPKMCGPDATAAARSAGYTGLIFGLTGNTDSAQLEAYKAKGADMVFTKPLDFSKLQEVIRLKLPGPGGL